jgi:D-methionine transport system ATP-binding protein
MAESAQIWVDRVSVAPNQRSAQSLHRLNGGTALLKDISFQVHIGEKIAIMGSSGSGKTTLARLINRLCEPTQGMLYFANQPYTQISPGTLRQQIMLVPQEPKLLGMTTQQALAYPLQLRRLSPSAIQQRLDLWLERLQIPTAWLDRTELQLSLGQRQWVAIARALVCHPPVIILDEPTSALDLGRIQQLISTLVTEAYSSQQTVLLISHQLDVVQKFCDRLLLLQAGQLVQDAPASVVDWPTVASTLHQAQKEALDEWGEV